MEVDHIVRTMVEFGSKALVLGRRVGSLYRREVKEAGELQGGGEGGVGEGEGRVGG
ncbi:hypothetical protein DEO72_LG5g1870 [Vigna unguiculata]|uniref:Uncharacterized protein n=1 Tax=Vigna unguiculata TaxID=3917 RepID=A0A4D6M153_VIGUN|nr:hypothetical protein DEO72_LG5g1870 [Vigna unguiculata]